MREKKKKNNKSDRLYTAHGQKMVQGVLSIINGKKALATFKGEDIVGYTTLEELNKEFYTRDLPQYNLNF
ncbi:MAG: hypothetical protein SO152_06860 [Ruminococcus sp.]|nr:hypothetical protein [Ruminococcus sp.]